MEVHLKHAIETLKMAKKAMRAATRRVKRSAIDPAIETTKVTQILTKVYEARQDRAVTCQETVTRAEVEAEKTSQELENLREKRISMAPRTIVVVSLWPLRGLVLP